MVTYIEGYNWRFNIKILVALRDYSTNMNFHLCTAYLNQRQSCPNCIMQIFDLALTEEKSNLFFKYIPNAHIKQIWKHKVVVATHSATINTSECFITNCMLWQIKPFLLHVAVLCSTATTNIYVYTHKSTCGRKQKTAKAKQWKLKCEFVAHWSALAISAAALEQAFSFHLLCG